ncbi:hypothetical protein IFR23_12665 [Sphingomonas sp. CFBP 13603]|uniref:hypothetical protein n=1 Tax=Sphingomonas sp. CFBP 13603 TaxID=2774040 RepID=UPI00186885CF|nr:hypothetical protein [Sphingomonas sp. CFBP 13603]MBE2992866.1 hypothetical protein [Sphingomonas sp. CFBP 13603]
MRPLFRLIALLGLCLGYALPAQAAVTITFWNHELGNSFPHAFVTLRGVPDAGGAPVDTNVGFTAKSLTPALLFGPVAGRLDIARPTYVGSSDAQFAVVMTDAQYDAVLRLVAAWSEGKPDSVYRLSDHNCVTFVKEAARIVGLTGLDQPRLMKKPRSYLKAVVAANAGRVTVLDLHGKAYLASLQPIAPATVITATGSRGIVTSTVPPAVPAAPR